MKISGCQRQTYLLWRYTGVLNLTKSPPTSSALRELKAIPSVLQMEFQVLLPASWTVQSMDLRKDLTEANRKAVRSGPYQPPLA